MLPFSCIFLSVTLLNIASFHGFAVSEAALNESIPAEKFPLKSENAIQLKPQSTRQRARVHHPLPPVAVPGILTGFHSSGSNGRRRPKHFQTELNVLKRGMTPADQPYIRKRRSIANTRMSRFAQQRVDGRWKRDLRRLRRELTSSLAPAKGYSQRFYSRPQNAPPPRGQDISHLLDNLNFFEELAALRKSAQLGQSAGGNGGRVTLLTSPSRFSLHPREFTEGNNLQNGPSMSSAPLPNMEAYIDRDGRLRLPEKRWPKPSAWGELSMVPGMKRSVFREAAREQDLRRSHGIVKRGRRESHGPAAVDRHMNESKEKQILANAM